MKRTIEIKKGATIDTIEGYAVITGMNAGGLVYLDNYEINEDGEEIPTGEIRWTLEEIRNAAKAVDGINHDTIVDYDNI